ncbi:MAG: TonB-dependent receptor [Bacteroidia bacterium]|nr:TonB-dependent receptor [Bacteroidia bacterium]
MLQFQKTVLLAFSFVFISIVGAQYPSQGGPGMGGQMGYVLLGKAVDSALGLPLNLATTSITDANTGKVIDGGLTDSTGKIMFMLRQPGSYYLGVTAVGYGDFKSQKLVLSDSVRFLNLGMIQLSAQISAINGATVSADKPLIENKVDKLIYNASQDIISKGGSATDLLRKVPMVEVDMDGNVSVRGSQNIRVLINGKPSGIVSASIKDALRTIPSDQIERVEVITNPSAKYDAEGTAGIINIVLKASKLKGTSGNIHAGGGNRSGHLGAGISVQNGKTGYNFRLGGFYWRNVGEGVTDRSNTYSGINYQLLQTSNNRTFGGGPHASIGLDHEFNKYSSMSVSATLRGNWNSTKSDWETRSGIASLPLPLLYGRNTNNFNLTLGYDVTADYRKTFKKEGREWGLSAQYNGNSQNTDYSANQTDSFLIEQYKEKSNNLGLNNEITLQTDFTEPISKKLLMESGVKGILRKVTSTYSFDSFNFANKEYSSITARSNSFFYNQNVYGGYSQFTWQINSKYSARVGGRYEFTTYNGGRNDSNTEFTGQPYGNFIPFFNVNRSFGYTGFLRFNYTQRLQRPSLFYLNPYTNFSDPRNLTTGNPYLRAEVANNFELSAGKYTQKGGGSMNVYHRRVNNAIETMRTVDSMGVYQTTYGNVGSNRTTGMDLNLNLKGKMWMLSFNGSVGYVQIKSNQTTGLVAGLSNSGITYSAGMYGFYKITTKWSMEGYARLNAPTFSLQGRTQNWYFHTLGIKRRFKNDVGGIGLGIDNPFTPRVTYTTVQTGTDFNYKDVREINMLGIRINFDYRFGKVEVEQAKKPKKGIKNDDLKQGGGDQGQGN